MTSRVLLTGATGFVGRHVLHALQSDGVPIRLVLRTGCPAPDGITDLRRSPNLFAETADWWAEVCTGIDYVLHLAWYAEPGRYQQDPVNFHCLEGTLRLARGAAAAGIRRFVGIGTCAEYDTAQRVLATDTPLRPSTPYAAAKAATFLALSQMLPSAGISFTWCRLFYVHGEGEDPRRLVPYLHHCLSKGLPADLTSGRQVRDFLDVAVAARRIVNILFSSHEGPANICSGEPITVRQLAERVADQYGRRDLLRFGARPDNPYDPECVLGLPTLVA